MKKLIILLTALFIISVIISCTSESSVNNEKINEVALIPDVEWVNRDGTRDPQGIDSIEIVLSSSSMGSNMVKKFPYINAEGKKEGTISGVPTGIVINVTLTALDSNNNVIYIGIVETSTNDPIGTSMAIEITATQVSPVSPTSLNANALSFNRINLIWADNSDNESNFIIERRLSDSTKPFLPIDTIGADENSYIDDSLKSSTVYVYRVKALNGSGTSEKYTNIDSAQTEYKDTIAPIIKITSHNNPDTVNTNTISIKGTIKDTSGIKEMYLGNLLIVPENGIWNVPSISLQKGENKYLIKAIDNSVFENTSAETLIVVYDSLFIDTTNDAPYFTITNSSLDTNISVGNNYSRVLKAEDPDAGDKFHFDVSPKLTLIEDTIKWQATISDTGDNVFWAFVIDESGDSSERLEWTVTVKDTTSLTVNSQPYFKTKVADIPKIANVGIEYTITVLASDDDPGDVVVYSKIQGPNSLVIDNQTGVISWTPDTADTGTSYTIQIEATDDTTSPVLLSWTVDVAKIVKNNNPPKFNKTSAELNRNIILGELYNDSITVSDGDSDAELTYTKLTDLTNFTFNGSGSKALMSWNVNTPGSHAVSLRVTDQHGAFDTVSYFIEVPENRPPVIETPASELTADIYPGDSYTRVVKFSDPENHNLTVKETEFTTGMNFRDNGDNSDSITWTPGIVDIGTHFITIQVTDDFDSIVELRWRIDVHNRVPVFEQDSISISGNTALVGNEYTIDIKATDPENKSITYTISIPNDNSVTINQDGKVSWTPLESNIGENYIRVMAQDGDNKISYLGWTVNVDFDPITVPFDTIFAGIGSNILIPVHTPNREFSNFVNGLKLSKGGANSFNNAVGNFIKEEYDTATLSISESLVNSYGTDIDAIVTFTNTYGSDTSDIFKIKIVDKVNLIDRYDSTAWTISNDNLTGVSKIVSSNYGFKHYELALDADVIDIVTTMGDTLNGDWPFNLLYFNKEGIFVSPTEVEVAIQSNVDVQLVLIQSDILNILSCYNYTIPASPTGMQPITLQINNNIFKQPSWATPETFDPTKIIGIGFNILTQLNKTEAVRIDKLEINGFVPDPK